MLKKWGWVLVLWLGCASANAANRGIVYTEAFRPLLNTLAAPRKKLQYYGGPVISHVRAYAVFWGEGVDPVTVQGIGGMLSATVNSTFMDWLSEYDTFGTAINGRTGSQQSIGRGAFGGAFTILPASHSTQLDDSEIQSELRRQIEGGKLPPSDADSLYLIYFPPGIRITLEGQASCEVFCGYHGEFALADAAPAYYGVLPDLGGACELGCGDNGSRFDNLTAVTSHELIEAVTDPQAAPGSSVGYPNAWCTADGFEIGDPCGDTSTRLVAPSAAYVLQQGFDNASAACAPGPYRSP